MAFQVYDLRFLRADFQTQTLPKPFVQIAYCLVIHTSRPTIAVLTDISICQFDVFGTFYQFHKIAEPLSLDTCGIQFVKTSCISYYSELRIFCFFKDFFLFAKVKYFPPYKRISFFLVILEPLCLYSSQLIDDD